jgi:hypothetical protein
MIMANITKMTKALSWRKSGGFVQKTEEKVCRRSSILVCVVTIQILNNTWDRQNM